MSIFDDIMAGDLAFINQAEFSEDLTITRGNGDRIVTTAVIDRLQVEQIAEASNKTTFAPVAEFWIPRTLLTSPPERGDIFNYPTQKGSCTTDHNFVSIMSQDGGGWRVRCR